jgi:hypothetical protein
MPRARHSQVKTLPKGFNPQRLLSVAINGNGNGAHAAPPIETPPSSSFMHWIAPSEKDTANDALEKRLWDAADEFRANSSLSSPPSSHQASGSSISCIFRTKTSAARVPNYYHAFSQVKSNTNHHSAS